MKFFVITILVVPFIGSLLILFKTLANSNSFIMVVAMLCCIAVVIGLEVYAVSSILTATNNITWMPQQFGSILLSTMV